MKVQARIPAALCALHNFIQTYDPDLFDHEYSGSLLEHDYNVAWSELGKGPASTAERRRADQHRDRMAQEMWDNYLEEHRQRGLPLPGN
jgi:hypothetical protein